LEKNVQPTVVKYGQLIILKHKVTNHNLHSHSLTYSGGSKQQQITAIASSLSNSDDHFQVLGSKNESSSQIASGAIIKLKHITTNAYLHSHSSFKSPITKQQEVTGYADDDSNNNWRVVCSTEYWTVDSYVRLIHVNTNAALHSHNCLSRKYSTRGDCICWTR